MTADSLVGVFDPSEDVVLIGAAGHRLGQAGVREYLTLLSSRPGARPRWEWDSVHVFLDVPGAVGFVSFGEVVVSDGGVEKGRPSG